MLMGITLFFSFSKTSKTLSLVLISVLVATNVSFFVTPSFITFISTSSSAGTNIVTGNSFKFSKELSAKLTFVSEGCSVIVLSEE